MNFKKNRKIIIGIIALILFIGTTIILLSGNTENLDKHIHNLVISLRTPLLTNIMLIITNLCSVLSLTIISIIFICFFRKKHLTFYIIINLINSILLSQLFKLIIRRNRPTDINLIEEFGFSYPSGHSMVSMAFFGLFAYLIYKNTRNNLLKYILIICLILTIILIGFSRIYLGVHYFSDVIGGFLISFSYLMLFINLTKLKNPLP